MINYIYKGCALLAVYFSLSGNAIPREFKDLKGRKINASVLAVADGKVKLKLDKNGKTYTIAFDKLSPGDVAFLKEWKKPASPKDADKKKKDAASDKPLTNADVIMMSTAKLIERFSLSENYDDNWPRLIKSPLSFKVNTVMEDKDAHKFVYQSANYEFVCDVQLSKSVVKKFAVLFEGTRLFCKQLPLSMMKAHLPGKQFKNRILLFETRETYARNGGSPTAGGHYSSRDNTIYIPLTSLGVKKMGSKYTYDYKGTNNTLPHELAHQLSDREFFQSGPLGWFSEGLAEYIAVTPYRSGKFMVNSNLSAIKAYATEFGKKGKGGRNLGKKINAPDLKKYMLQSYSEFTANGNFNYGLGMLITYYYLHWDGKGERANINAFLKACKAGKEGEEALNVLLNGRSWDEMEKQITKAWSTRGVKITFK